MPNFSSTDLVLNADGSLYHLNLLPGDVAKTIILVGDPGRVSQVSAFFDKIYVEKGKREFLTHTGSYNDHPISVISTGIGTDNIDIVINELDALFNIDLKQKELHNHRENLQFIRLGTCGTINPAIETGTPIISDFALGLDNLASFYNVPLYPEEEHLHQILSDYFKENGFENPFYIGSGSAALREQFSTLGERGITLTCPGFYGPQGRTLRADTKYASLLPIFKEFALKGLKIQNLEMETSAIYALSKILDHDCCTINLALANRETGNFLSNYDKTMNAMIKNALDLLTRNGG